MEDDKFTAEDLVEVIPPEIAEMVLVLMTSSNGDFWSELVYLAYVGRTQLDKEIEAGLIDLESN